MIAFAPMSKSRRTDLQPEPLFEIRQMIHVPVEIAESKLARVVGVELGPENGRTKKKTQGWLYTLVFIPNGGWPTNERLGVIPSGEGFLATEEEIISWQPEHS